MTDILIIIALILLNGVFSMSEIALVSARKSKLSAEAKKGNRGAKTALRLIENPDRFLSTVQIGITLIGILTGLFSGAAFAAQLGDRFCDLGLPDATAHRLAQILIVAVVTYLSIVIGELIPKRIGIAMSDRISIWIAPLMQVLSVVTMPVIWLLSVSTDLVVRLLGLRGKTAVVTEDEIRSLIQEGTEAGQVQEVEQDIMERALMMGDQTVSSIMTNRSDIVSLNCRMSVQDIKDTVFTHLHRGYPLYCEKGKEVTGIVLASGLLRALDRGDVDLKKIAAEPVYFPESMTVYDALAVLKSGEVECALVCDEFGDMQGIVTLRDVLEGLVGMINDPADNPQIRPLADNAAELIVDGQYRWYDFLSYLEAEDLYRPAAYSTVAGWFLETYRHLPHEGETVEWQGIRFKILDMDGARIDKFLVSRINPDRL